MRQLLCRDMGNECEEVLVAADDEEVLQMAADHISSRHPDMEFGTTAQGEVKLLIQDA